MQLVHKIPTLVPSVRKAIDADPGLPKKALRDQFEKLILQPLNCIDYNTVVIDALDKCDVKILPLRATNGGEPSDPVAKAFCCARAGLKRLRGAGYLERLWEFSDYDP
ncbi:hypothetical protein B0T21DRAFT_361784 [Apiosordaria backusii]|uniref:Uncharacterized protein n=1 Tax=Apiosordaria backusii TaxID=314023 RepID=A0AA40BRF7_9PEZI|nr:hypothetical protein B0T21DRAFT_361784 [Apiosordaria backusii]